MADKRTTLDDAVAGLADGMTIGIGGWASRRKPMALVRAICRSDVKDLTVVSYGGPDVGLLCAYGKVRKVVFGFVSLDTIAIEPWFRRARQEGAVEVMELDEGMLQWGLYAAANRLPFMPTRSGLGSDILTANPELDVITSPYGGQRVVAMPPLKVDAAFVHMNRADAAGNGQYLGPDLYFDDLFCLAADTAIVSCERIVETAELASSGPLQSLGIRRFMVDGVIEAPSGAHFTSCVPDYERDEEAQRSYAKTAADERAWAEFRERYVDVSHDAYLTAVGE